MASTDGHKIGGGDAFTVSDLLDAVARVKVRKNTGSDIGIRRRLNLIEGQNITVTMVDDPTDEEIDITVEAIPAFGRFLKIGSYYRSLLMIGGATNNEALVASKLYAVLYPVVQKSTFDRIAVHVYSTTAGNKIHLGIYNDGGGYPSSLVLDAGELTLTAGAGIKELTINQQLDAGVYWLAILGDASNNIYYGITNINMIGSLTSMAGSPVIATVIAQTYGALPDPFPSGGVGAFAYALGMRLASVP